MDYYLIGFGKAAFIWIVSLTCIPVLIWFERKGAAFIQERTGPNRAAILGVRLAGFIHNISDVVKLLMKEIMIPSQVNKWYFVVAPFIGITLVLFAFAVINLGFPQHVDRGDRHTAGHGGDDGVHRRGL